VVLALVVYPYYGWRGLLALSATPLLIFTILSPVRIPRSLHKISLIKCIFKSLQWLSESARYYSYNGHNDKAIKVLEQVSGNFME